MNQHNLLIENEELVADKTITAAGIINRIKKQVTCNWLDHTVDTFKAGNPHDRVRGILCTFIPTLEVLRKAVEMQCNLVITHEPTFYNHQDESIHLKNDPVYRAKQKIIDDNGLIIWRFHDHWHRTQPDGIMEGMLRKLNWKSKVIHSDPVILRFPEMYVGEFVRHLKRKFKQSPVRVTGDPVMSFSRVAFAPGSRGCTEHIKLLSRPDVDVLVCGEEPEWASITYVRDLVALEKRKAMILMGHLNSEEGGMEYCAEWLGNFIHEVPIRFVQAGDPFVPYL